MVPIEMRFVVVLIACIATLDQANGVPHEEAPPAKPHNGHSLLCNVCWSTISASDCQNVSKSEPCTPTGMDTVVGKLAPQNASSSPAELSLPGGGVGSKKDAVRYRCFTLSYTLPIAEAGQSAIYAKGCTTSTFDPCAGMQQANASCIFCTGNNCNAAASHKKSIPARSKATTTINSSSSSYWLLEMTLIVIMVFST